MKVQLYQVDAFTNQKFYGNPAGVIIGADGLSDAMMQAIAKELNNTESAFVFRPDANDHDIHVRFFTPTTEIPMCGHNTVALHAVRVMENICDVGRYVQKTKAGMVDALIKKENGKVLVTMTQKNPVFDTPLSVEAFSPLLNALNISTDDLRSDLPVQVVSTGNRKVFLPVRSRKILNALKPSMPELKKLGAIFNCTGYYIFAMEDGESDAFTHGRMFAPQIGIDEDPVTGMAIAPLGAYLVKNKAIPLDGQHVSFNAKQGEAMGRPGIAYVHVSTVGGQPSTIDVSGEAVIVFKAELEV